MKLIIDISEMNYTEILKDDSTGSPFEDEMSDLIKNGIPLDDVKAEIQAKEMVETDIEKQFYNMALGDVIEILNNIGKESEGV